MIYKDFDFMNPDYRPVFAQRAAVLARIRKQPERVPELKAYYRNNIADFINDWGVTFDPRNTARRGVEGERIPSVVPFVLWKRQRELVDWTVWHWQNSEDGVVPKSREVGVSWIMISISCSLGALFDGYVGGFGSRKAAYVDNGADPKSLFWKGREFIRRLPREFRGGWARDNDAVMRIQFPETGSYVTGEGGDNIGRGDRTSLHIIDEAAHLEHPDQVDAALSETTTCRIDVSSVKGLANSFASKSHEWDAKHVFYFHWRDDPRKNDAWYANRKRRINNDAIVAQELDIDFNATTEGQLIPAEWVQAAIDAHIKLQIHPRGVRLAGLDVADEGVDLNAFCGVHGIVIEHLETWSGKGMDINSTTTRAFRLCDQLGYSRLNYDGDGVGAGVRGAARVANEQRLPDRKIAVHAYRGTSAIINPNKKEYGAATNDEMFASYNAQQWWRLRELFRCTWRAVVKGEMIDEDMLISIPIDLPYRKELVAELAQIQWDDTTGAIKIEKTPDNMKSPNLADSLKIAKAQFGSGVVVPKPAIKGKMLALENARAHTGGTGMRGMLNRFKGRSSSRVFF